MSLSFNENLTASLQSTSLVNFTQLVGGIVGIAWVPMRPITCNTILMYAPVVLLELSSPIACKLPWRYTLLTSTLMSLRPFDTALPLSRRCPVPIRMVLWRHMPKLLDTLSFWVFLVASWVLCQHCKLSLTSMESRSSLTLNFFQPDQELQPQENEHSARHGCCCLNSLATLFLSWVYMIAIYAYGLLCSILISP